ncbi:hypothetical protein Agub_g14056 [Astrephomene gubernaculifera]|uniref:Peptidase M11 gametolysin domain-containing protein n=1 Tax=Astrephomene gubernaculifera TaxID=47775 RepID=A0AAD3E0Z6_9CHLO|nr:hypothetical protein Agub_g14056 [Astrephomene gubernaculifera]
MAGNGCRELKPRRICSFAPVDWLGVLCLLHLSASLGRAQSIVSLQGKLVVLNEPRRGSHLAGRTTYHFRLPAPDATTNDWVLYSLRFAPGVALPEGAGGRAYLTGDIFQLSVDLDRSGPLPAGTPYQDSSDAAAAAAATAKGPAGTLYVKAWSYMPYSYGLANYLGSESASASSAAAVSYYLGGSDPLKLRMIVWVVSEVCGVEVAAGGTGAISGMTTEDVSELLFGPQRPSPASAPRYPPMTLARLWDACSYGSVRLKRPYIQVVNISLPCGGTRANGAAWRLPVAAAAGAAAAASEGGTEAGAAETEAEAGLNTTAGGCGANALWGMMEYASNFTREVLGLDPAPYLRRVLLLPYSAAAAAPASSSPPAASASLDGSSGGGVSLCPGWQQRGSLGCDAALGCDMWIKSDPSQLLQWLTTQLGASMGLQPATAPPHTALLTAAATSPAAAAAAFEPPAAPASTSAASAVRWLPSDPSCAMGSPGGGYRCFNAPNSLKLFFSQPARRLDSSNMSPGASISVQLPAAAAGRNNLLLLAPSEGPLLSPPAPGSTPLSPTSGQLTLFVQYRVPIGGDAGLAAAVRAKVVVHSLNASAGTAGGPMGRSPPSRLVAMITPGEVYRDTSARVVIRFLAALPPPAGDDGGVTGGGASLALCRYLWESEAAADGGAGCANGVDDDCDGLVDEDDPDCAPDV